MKRVGVDVGGTFTDLILVDEEEGRITVDKVPSTPDDPSRSVVEGVQALCTKAGVALGDVDNLLHGTTVATNIVLTHTGAEAGMITTHGFRDIIHIARHKKPFNFSLQQELPWQSRPLVKRRHRLTVEERKIVVDRVAALRDRMADTLLSSVPDTFESGDRARKIAGNCHVCFDGIESEALLFLLEQHDVMASAAASCASGAQDPSHVLAALGFPRRLAQGSLRLSLGATSADADVDLALEVIPPAVARLRERGS